MPSTPLITIGRSLEPVPLASRVSIRVLKSSNTVLALSANVVSPSVIAVSIAATSLTVATSLPLTVTEFEISSILLSASIRRSPSCRSICESPRWLSRFLMLTP